MKICYVAVDVVLPYHRGSSTHTYEIASNLIKLGNVVYVVSRRLNRRQLKYEVIDGIHVYRIYRGMITPLRTKMGRGRKAEKASFYGRILKNFYRLFLRSLYLLYATAYVAHIVKKFDIDVIFERGSSLGAGALAAKLARKPLALEVIDPNYADISVKTAEKIFIYTNSILRGSVDKEKLATITAGANTELFRPDVNGSEVRKKYNISENELMVGYVGSFAQWRGIEDLVEASKAIFEIIPEVKFLMVGPNYYHIQKITEEERLSKAFIFTGPVPYSDVPKYVAASDVMVALFNPSKNPLMKKYGYYFSPIKVLEAMACGKPIVTTSLNMIKELLGNGENGILVPPGNPQELAYAIIKLLKDKNYAETLGKNARRLIEKKHSWLVVTKKINSILQSIAGITK